MLEKWNLSYGLNIRFECKPNKYGLATKRCPVLPREQQPAHRSSTRAALRRPVSADTYVTKRGENAEIDNAHVGDFSTLR